jgi:hypothetical protein
MISGHIYENKSLLLLGLIQKLALRFGLGTGGDGRFNCIFKNLTECNRALFQKKRHSRWIADPAWHVAMSPGIRGAREPDLILGLDLLGRPAALGSDTYRILLSLQRRTRKHWLPHSECAVSSGSGHRSPLHQNACPMLVLKRPGASAMPARSGYELASYNSSL